MSVGIAQPWWNSDWQHVEDRTEPPEPVEDGHTCYTCYHFDHCPTGDCAWGVCLARSDTNGACWVHELDTDNEHECKEWEEA